MQLITSPSIDRGIHPISVFLAGGITDCANWQKAIAVKLSDLDATIFNPRRIKMPKSPLEITRQIEWEHWRIRRSKIVAFWFAPETLNPITLLELGAALARKECQSLVVGCHEDYARRFDVITQCRLSHQQVLVGFNDFVAELRDLITIL